MIFCPICGNELSETATGLACQSGEMELTKELEKRLRECYFLKLRQPREIPFSSPVGKWFCPQCGVPTQEKAGIARCPQCQLSVNEFVFSLVEHHYHRL